MKKMLIAAIIMLSSATAQAEEQRSFDTSDIRHIIEKGFNVNDIDAYHEQNYNNKWIHVSNSFSSNEYELNFSVSYCYTGVEKGQGAINKLIFFRLRDEMAAGKKTLCVSYSVDIPDINNKVARIHVDELVVSKKRFFGETITVRNTVYIHN